MREWRRRVQSPFFPALVALGLYLPSLSFDRTLDDAWQVPAPGEPTLQSWTGVWTQPYWNDFSGGGLFRPVTSATFWAESRFGTPLWARHLVNVILNAIVTLLLVRLARAMGLGALAALVAGLIFALHPAHVEAVAGIVGRAEILAALWISIALLLHHRALSLSNPPPAGLSLPIFALLSFLAAGSKESAWSLAVLALPLHAMTRTPLRKGWPAFLGYGTGLLAHLLLRHHVLGGWISAPGQVISADENKLVLLHGWDRLGAGLRVGGVFLSHLVLPLRLSPDYSGDTVTLTGSIFDPHFLGGSLLLVGCPALLWWGWRHRGSSLGVAALVSGTWIGTAFLLTMNVFFNLATLVADRLLYWPSAGWAILAAALVFETRVFRESRWRVFAFAPALLLVVTYSIVTATYLPAWKNNLALFEHARTVAPSSARVWSGYGQGLREAGRLPEALDALHQSERLSPTYELAWSQEASILIEMGRLDEARRPLAEALRLVPTDTAAQLNEAILWLHEGRFTEALPRLRDAVARNPRDVLARGYLAMALEMEGSREEASAAWQSYFELASRDAEAMNALARVLAAQPEGAAQAEVLARRAIAIDPGNPEFLDTLGEALFHQGKVEEAAAAWRDYLKQVPEDANVLNDLAWILATRLNKPEEAEALARQSVRISPKNPAFRDTLAESLWRQGKTDEAARVAREALTLEGASPDLQRFLVPKH